MAGKETGSSEYPALNVKEHRDNIVAVAGVSTNGPGKPQLDKSLERPPAFVDGSDGRSVEGYEISDRIPTLLLRIKEDRQAAKSFYASLSSIGNVFEYKENRTDLETVFLSEVLEGKIRLAGDLNRKGITQDPEKMPVFERIDKAEWLAENGSLVEAEKELETVRVHVALVEERIRLAYEKIPVRTVSK
ncbi:MAG: hypothetical protein QG650_267 [Patescibacteria group bacterium]|nr:hypothetical protein [Patescibacteria group bacterium]